MKRIWSLVITMLMLLPAVSVHGSSQVYGNELTTIITNPADRRPITNEYVAYWGECIGADVLTTSKIYDDFYASDTHYQVGDAKAIRQELLNLVRSSNNAHTTVVVNMASYLNGGLTATRYPTTYGFKETALTELEQMIQMYNAPNYYININIPRAKPETRGFDWGQDKKVKGYEYFVQKANVEKTFDQVLFQYTCVKTKMAYEKLTWDEQVFMSYFEDMYIDNAPSEFCWNGQPYSVLYENMFTEVEDMIMQLAQLTQRYPNVELVISVDDLSVPAAIKQEYPNQEKYTYSYDLIQKIKASGLLESRQISLLYGYDDVPQLTLARDYTKRTGNMTQYNIVYMNGEINKNYIGTYDSQSIENILTQSISFINAYGTTIEKECQVYIHNSDNPSNLLTKQAAEMWVNRMKEDAYAMVLDLKTNSVDTVLAEEIAKQGFPIQVYSGWNTIGNTISLGLAQGQVCKCNHKCKLFTQHIYEDWIYNSFCKSIDSTQLKETLQSYNLNLPYSIFEVYRPYNRNFECTLILADK